MMDGWPFGSEVICGGETDTRQRAGGVYTCHGLIWTNKQRREALTVFARNPRHGKSFDAKDESRTPAALRWFLLGETLDGAGKKPQ